MSKIKTTEDGWECVPELKEAVRAINGINDMCYEINNCVRSRDLESLVNNMTAALEHAIGILEDIDTSDQYITVDDEDDEDESDYDALYNATRGITTDDPRMPDWFKKEVLPEIKADPFYKSDSYLD
jgi:hypothetical protein